jgi:hypothetical protein
MDRLGESSTTDVHIWPTVPRSRGHDCRPGAALVEWRGAADATISAYLKHPTTQRAGLP